LPFFLLPFALSFFLFFAWRRWVMPTRRYEMQFFRTKWGSIANNCGKIAISRGPVVNLSNEMRFDRQKLR
jgi:hypothetical protein